MPESLFGTPRFSAAYQLNKDEMIRVFDHAYAGHAGRTRLILQSIALAVVGGISLIDFITIQPRRGMSLFLAVISLVVGVAQWIVMPLFRRAEVNRQLAENPTIRLALYEDGIAFGEGDGQMLFAFENCGVIAIEDMLILRVGREFVGLPDRVIGEDNRLLLTEQIPPVKK